jgi:hypothetical protein
MQGAMATTRGRFILIADSYDSHDCPQLGLFLSECAKDRTLSSAIDFAEGFLPGLCRFYMPGIRFCQGSADCFSKIRSETSTAAFLAFAVTASNNFICRCWGMECASEMIVKATLFGLRITGIPTTLSLDGRKRASHLRPWRDGWRHLRFLMLYSPRWLFLYPGTVLFTLAMLASIWLLWGPRTVGRITFDAGALLFSGVTIRIGFGCLNFAAFTEVFAVPRGFRPADPRLSRLLRPMQLEIGLALGVLLLLAGVEMWGAGLRYWGSMHFGNLNPAKTLRLVVPGIVSLTLGFQTMLSSFFLGALGMEQRQ